MSIDVVTTECAWHGRTADETLAALVTGSAGLDDPEVRLRRQRFGPNRLISRPAAPAWKVLLDQFRSVVVLLLVAAALVSFGLGDHIEGSAIVAVLMIDAGIGFVTELRARRAIEALLRLDVSRATVVRSGRLRDIDAVDLVPGDVIRLDVGQRVPADARLIDSSDLQTDEAALTGESMPVSKRADVLLDPGTPLADRTNMVYKSTHVVAGTAHATVTATGPASELGRIGAMVGGVAERRTPLERQLDVLGRRLVWLALGVAALVSLLGALHGAPLALVIRMGIALAVAAVPESLPVVATIALAVGIRRMAHRRALVRRLPAVEALGSTTVVCTDKTRTLTSGRMTVVRLHTMDQEFELTAPAGATSDPGVIDALQIGALASRLQPRGEDGEGHARDPVDLAFIEAARRIGIEHSRLVEAQPRAGLVPFSSERKFMASLHRKDGELIAHVKGAADRVLGMCRRVRTERGESALDESRRESLMAANDRMARGGLRVLALARGPVPEGEKIQLENLTFVGLVGLADPPAEGVKETIARLRGAGLRTIMLTGDQAPTAAAIGRDLGLLDEGHASLDGNQLDALPPGGLEEKLSRVTVFSRITPEHKLRLVEALQERGDVVAMLGDGVNDAPALRRADIGVAMGGRGTDVAREAAAIVLQDDRFETVAAAVEEGRVIFDNIRKFVFYLFSCNVAEVLLLLCTSLAGLPLPLLPLQILWLNLVTDTFPALALALEPGDPQMMTRPPRNPQRAILSGQFIGSVLFYGAVITMASLAAYALALESGPVERARSVAFMTLALAQLLHLGNARSRRPVLEARRVVANPFALGAVALSFLLQLAATYLIPLAELLRVVPLAPRDWVLVTVCAATPAILGQGIRSLPARRAKGTLFGHRT